MDYGTAYDLLRNNSCITKMIADNGEEISWLDLQAYQLNRDRSNMEKWEVYVKISKQYCPKLIVKNKSLELTKFDEVKCPKSYKCRALGYVWHGGPDDCYALMGPYECFPQNSTLVENTPEYFMLKCTFYNVTKKDMYHMCCDMLYYLHNSCTNCLEKEWKQMSVPKFKALNNFKKNDKGR